MGAIGEAVGEAGAIGVGLGLGLALALGVGDFLPSVAGDIN